MAMNPELILVDDDKILLIILKKMIGIVNPDCQLTAFSSASDALAYISVNPGRSCWIMLDINLKEMSAWEFMDELMVKISSPPNIILMTSSVSSSNVEKAKKYSSVIGFFEKPVTVENVRQIFELINKD